MLQDSRDSICLLFGAQYLLNEWRKDCAKHSKDITKFKFSQMVCKFKIINLIDKRPGVIKN